MLGARSKRQKTNNKKQKTKNQKQIAGLLLSIGNEQLEKSDK